MSTDRYLPSSNLPKSLQLLLFLDERMTSYVQNQEIRDKLAILNAQDAFELQVVDVGKQPDLAEHYRVIATPALLKLYPTPRQILAGSNLIDQIDNWWERWQEELVSGSDDILTNYGESVNSASPAPKTQQLQLSDSLGYVSKMIKLTDEIFTLKQEKEQLLDRLKLQDRAMSVLAHDLRNPLTAAALALGTLEIIHNPQDYRANSLEPATIAKLIERARTQLQSIDRLVTDILQPLATPTVLALHPQKLDLMELISVVVSQLDPQFQLKSQVVTTDIPQDIPFVYGDVDKLRQTISNLLDNASKYTPTGGQIHISALHRTAQTIQVSIADSGLGIPVEQQKQIFQDRVRLDRDLSQSGYGIGLSVCQQIVRAHYGQIWVESAPGKGSVFNFTLLVYQG
ncbi:histidine kinase [Chamaesiphon minutus]|uniref:histidine kinase n=1 Tax=Chamaesiphon minutus (strain ATCC 27169 / PCC 6605) TaxID=1173020 RepID=K9UBR2_CHAP6|nr:histidine kinase [Chamaesiphon minutus]AFY91659.1 histidine kinase,KaiB domain-containing protein,histidine kinase [Chamaesiphon minutus PCC 6605]